MGIQLSSKLPGLRRKACSAALGGATALALLSVALVPEGRAESISCPERGGAVMQGLRFGGTGTGAAQPDLEVNGICIVDELADFHYRNVNVVKGGRLIFLEPPQPADVTKNKTNFWASSIVIENGGSVEAGLAEHAKLPEELGSKWDKTWTPTGKAYGVNGNVVNIMLYGADQSGGNPVDVSGLGAACVQPRCGIPEQKDGVDLWKMQVQGQEKPVTLPGGVTDIFYMYHGLKYDDKAWTTGPQTGEPGYFGYKVLALSYGGKLQLRGYKGSDLDGTADTDPTLSGSSWTRLSKDLEVGKNQIFLDGGVPAGWTAGDRIVVTTTDYLPNHSEEFTIVEVKPDHVVVDRAAEYFHNGTAFPVEQRLSKASSDFKTAFYKPDGDKKWEKAETRAAVGLLTRSIRIVSGGDKSGQPFDWESEAEKKKALEADPEAKSATDLDPKYQFGAHTIFRQGFEKLQIQGVEFRWMGQGGRLGHYPVHFHMARKVPDDTFVKDSAINESMTRWIVLHATQNVLMQRNVGYKSIGHGFYLEDATETDNRLFSNLGVYARAAVEGPDNPRSVPGILSHPDNGDQLRYRSDITNPTVFWITNGWNDFVGNMAAGAGTCGACYWLPPATDNANMKDMAWSGYAALQHRVAGTAPLKQFYKNSCSTAMHSFNGTGSTAGCTGVNFYNTAGALIGPDSHITPVKQSFAPTNVSSPEATKYYPALSGLRIPTICNPPKKFGDPDDCQQAKLCAGTDPIHCATTVLDSYTSSFNWAETNFSAIWLRGGWNLIDRSFISDVQNGGIGLISGGDYSKSSAPLGYWTMISHSVLVGQTQPDNGFASIAGPKKPGGKQTVCSILEPNACIVKDAAVAYPLSNWATNRLFNIYDGPAYQYANAYLDIPTSPCLDKDSCMYFGNLGVRRSQVNKSEGYLPNAAIGWKQPNGFYYPPAFHSEKLFFDKVDIRHYLTVPLFKPGTYIGDTDKMKKELIGGYNEANPEVNKFTGYTDIDRQTVLNDVDGTLTGFKRTISVNEDPFFSAPVQTAECLSNKDVLSDTACAPKKSKYTPVARTSPYDHVTTVVYPECAASKDGANRVDFAACGTWSGDDQWDGAPPGPDRGARYLHAKQRGGTWSRDCGGPYCTGVRLYRQYLTSSTATGNAREWQDWEKNGCDKAANAGKPECDYPFIRMAGAAVWQRNALTANNGKYYIDTTRSHDFQRTTDALGKPGEQGQDYVECDLQKNPKLNCSPRSVNVFEAGGTYYLFLLFAKEDTRQTYQVYVGPDFKISEHLKGVRMVEGANNFAVDTKWALPEGWAKAELIEGTTKGVKDVLEVTLDYAKLPASINLNPKTDTHGTCKPASFCTRTGAGSCGCSLSEGDSALLQFGTGLKQTCDKICSDWAVKDLDCPQGGCLGFSFTMPAGFKADDKDHRPAPEPFPTVAGSPWLQGFDRLGDKTAAGACYYSEQQTPSLTGSCQPSD
ncbi:MAG: hypothetical protein RIB84_20130 [Sneathiellaceae bacterium]